MEYHYVYLIKNIDIGKKYIGVRTSKNRLPKEDIGNFYFSSSTDKEFLEEQALFPERFRYKVIKTFNTRQEANAYEVYLHSLKQVSFNSEFYNKASSTPVGFCTLGLKWSKEKKLKTTGKNNGMYGRTGSLNPNYGKIHSAEVRKLISEANSGKNNPAYGRTGEKHPLYQAGENHPMFGRKHSEETKCKISEAKKGRKATNVEITKRIQSIKNKIPLICECGKQFKYEKPFIKHKMLCSLS